METDPKEKQAETTSEQPEVDSSDVQPQAALNESNEPIQQNVIEVLKTIYDPEIPVNIYELGLIYEIEVKENNYIHILMTLTSPSCPVAETLPPEVEIKCSTATGVNGCVVEVVWEPTWTPDMMSEAAKLELNMW